MNEYLVNLEITIKVGDWVEAESSAAAGKKMTDYYRKAIQGAIQLMDNDSINAEMSICDAADGTLLSTSTENWDN